MNIVKIAAIAAGIFGVTLIAPASWAQGDGGAGAPARVGGGNPRTGGQEPSRRNFSALRFFGPTYAWNIAMWAEVREALTIDREQLMAIGRVMLTNRPPQEGASGDPEGAFKRYHINNDDAVLRVLKPEQRKRVQELFVQYNGGLALAKFEVAKEVGISDEVKEKITALIRANTKLMKAEDAQRLAGTEVKTPVNMGVMHKEAKAKIESWLTEAQLAKLKELGGEKFEFRDHSSGGMGGAIRGQREGQDPTRAGGRGGRGGRGSDGGAPGRTNNAGAGGGIGGGVRDDGKF